MPVTPVRGNPVVSLVSVDTRQADIHNGVLAEGREENKTAPGQDAQDIS